MFPPSCLGCKKGDLGYLCPECRKLAFEPAQSLVFEKRLWTLGPYSGLLKESILKIKSQGHKAMARELAEAAAGVVVDTIAEQQKIDVILAVPSSLQGQKFRGFSLPQMIEDSLLETTDWPTLSPAMRRAYRSAVKTSRGLSRDERLSRTRRVSAEQEAVNQDGGTLLLIDDVVTTGSTLGRCIEQATIQGFTEILCFALAEHRTPED